MMTLRVDQDFVVSALFMRESHGTRKIIQVASNLLAGAHRVMFGSSYTRRLCRLR